MNRHSREIEIGFLVLSNKITLKDRREGCVYTYVYRCVYGLHVEIFSLCLVLTSKP